MRRLLIAIVTVVTFCTVTETAAAGAGEPLPSWNDGPSKAAVLAFVEAVTDEKGSDFVPAAERIAVFDNDGTLWAEKPMYFQAMFVRDRVKALAPQHPEWKRQQPFAALLRGDVETALAEGEKALLEMVVATHSGMTSTEFRQQVSQWLESATHPGTDRLYTDMVYQPMLELLAYLRANGFKTFIASAGGVEFMRAFAEKAYGIPPEQVIGSRIKMELAQGNGEPVLRRMPEIGFINDKAGKPVGIYEHIGRRPLAAFGNSDGDLQMLEWTTAGDGSRLALLVHHTDPEREFAYDRDSHVGRLDKALDAAQANGWTVVDMKRDWAVVFP